MLEIRPNCEHCGKFLQANSELAMICSYECTFCTDCVENVLHNVCPNCGGGFERRPVRPQSELLINPASNRIVQKTVDFEKFALTKKRYLKIDPSER